MATFEQEKRSIGEAAMAMRGLYRGEEDATLLTMRREGRRFKEVARALGRTRQSIARRLVRLQRAVPDPIRARIKRACLGCSGIFLSVGKHERVCVLCKSRGAWKSGGDYSLADPATKDTQ
jgi:hypothetical protein